MNPGHIVGPLKSVVIDDPGALHAGSKTAEARYGYPRDTPGGRLRIKYADTQVLDHVDLVLQLIAIVVIETGIAKAEFIDQGRLDNTRVRKHSLLDAGSQH